MRGEIVLIRGFRGCVLVRKVWESDEKAVHVATDDGFYRLQSGSGMIPAGFHRGEVFKYRKELQEEVMLGKIDWSNLEPYSN